MKKFLHSISLLGLAALATPNAFASTDATVTAFADVYGEPGKTFQFYAQLNNKGTEDITKISYDIQITGIDEDQSYTMELDTPVPAGEKRYITWQATAPDELGISKTMKIKLTKLNDVEVSKSGVSGKLHTEEFVPVHRSLVEDYTGTWCGYCPRGYVAMEGISRDYPNKVLTMAYHYSDPMDVATMSEPMTVSGYPTLHLNRSTASASSVAGTALKKSNTLTNLAVNVTSAQWLDDNHSSAKIVATLEFGEDVEAGDYDIDFFFVENGLSGTTSSWRQSTYYYGGSAEWTDPLWNQFIENDDIIITTSGGYTYYYVPNLTFNDVCIANASATASFDPVLPAATARQPFEVEFTFENINAIKEYGSSRKILQNPDECRLAVVVTKDANGEFVNCDWMKIGGESGINSVNADAAVSDLNAPVEYFNLQGMRVENPEAGQLLIKRQGNTATKVVIR
jgi:thiol-disulfide isomerase/thioredoxin